MNLKPVRDVVESCTYSQRNMLDSGLTAQYDPKTRQAQFHPFYRYDALTSTGTCSELMEYAFRKIKPEAPDLQVTRALGKDPHYFAGAGSTHNFLLLSEEDLLWGTPATTFPGILGDIRSKDPIVADPSFGRVGKLSELGYGLSAVYGEDWDIGWSNTAVTKYFRESRPLEFDSDGNLFSLVVDANPPSFSSHGVWKTLEHMFGDTKPPELSFAFRKEGEEAHAYALHSQDLDERVRDEEQLRKYIDLFRSLQWEERQGPFEEKLVEPRLSVS